MEFEIDSPIRSAAGDAPARRNRMRAAGVALAAGVLLTFGAASANAQSISDLNARIASAQSQAQSMSADVQAKADQVAAAQQQAAAAAQKADELSNLLAEGQQRSAELAVKVDKTQAHLQRARDHLRRALRALQDRLVAIYQGNAPNATELLLNSHGFPDPANRAAPPRRHRTPAEPPRLRRPGDPGRARRPAREVGRRPDQPGSQPPQSGEGRP